MKPSRHNARTILLLLVEAMLLFSGLTVAVYVRLGAIDAEDALIRRHGFYKAALATIFCLTSFYLFDLYDFVVMHDRGELVLRLLQALGLAWIALALLFYVVPQVMIGRGVSLISLPVALLLMVGWRMGIHWVLGHPELGERILIVGSGPFAIEVARETLHRPDAGFRIVGFVDNDPKLIGKSLINPKVIGLTSELASLVKRESIDRIVVAIGDRRGQFPTQELLRLSLSGDVSIEESASFYERITGRVLLDMNLFGPRPERPNFVAQLAQEIDYYEQRHLIAPGLTGWAQIKYPYGASIEDAKKKLEYDLYYIKNQNLMLDATIMFETIKTILSGRGT